MSRIIIVFLAILFGAAATSAAQTGSAIAGTVTDPQGLPLPGVTVEASSPALIEKVRVTTTDSQGLYQITNLRAGVYAVKFALEGFATLRQETLELTSAFTATVNAQLSLGTLGEQVTVVGGAPLLDTQNVVQRKVVTRDVIDAVPTGNRSWAAVAMLIPGAKVTGGANVGGTTSSQAAATIHGSRIEDSLMLHDGLRYNQGLGTGGGRNALTANDGAVDQISFETAALGAESETGGFVHNIIPKEGGNRFSGSFAANYSHSSFQADNLSDELRSAGAANTADKIRKTWDFNPALGGPIVQDRLWFFGAFRNWGYERQIANRFFNLTPTGLTYTPDVTRPAIDYQQKIDRSLRFTLRTTERSKLAVFYQIQADIGAYRYGNSRLQSPEALPKLNQNPNYMTQGKWQLTATSRLLFDVGFTYVNNDFNRYVNPANDTSLPGIVELRTGVEWRNPVGTWGHNSNHQRNVAGSVSYVTGAHSFKAGGLFMQGDVSSTQDATGNSTSWRFLDGRPSAIVVFATPLRFEETLNMAAGVFAQDQWKIHQLTLNAGVRFDFYNASVPQQSQSPGFWVPNRSVTFDEVKNVPNWKDWMPRVGASYDLFGTGRTALKATLSKYMFGSEIVSYTRLANPSATIATSATRSWNDANGDFIPQDSELGPISARDFGSARSLQRFDPTINNGWGKRGNNWEVSTSVDHQLTTGIVASAAYFHRWWHNLMATQNQAVTAADYSPYCITSPTDSRLPGGGGNQICGFYDVSPAKFGATDNVITAADNFGTQKDSYDALDLSLNIKLPKGATLAGGTNTERFHSNFCYAQTDPSITPQTLMTAIALPAGRSLNNCDVRTPWLTQLKFYVVVPVPRLDMDVSASVQSAPGGEIAASYTATNAEIAPSLGRNLSAGPNATATVQLIAPATQYGDRFNQLDLRLTKRLNVSGTKVQAMFDLYNVLNGNTVLTFNTAFGSQWLAPTSMMTGRLAKLGLQIRF